MNYSRFVDNFKVSNICYGTWNLSRSTKKFPSPGSFNKRQSIKLINFAKNSGINFFDTADIYGEGQSEKILGEALKSCRKENFIITKGGIINKKNDTNFSVNYMEKQLNSSLKNINSDYIDGYQLHNLNSNDKIKTVFKYLVKLKNKGIIRSIGFSSRDPQDANKILKKFNFDFLQVSFSIFDQRLLSTDLFKTTKKNQCFLLTRSPFNSGLLLNSKKQKEIFNIKFKQKINDFVQKNESQLKYKNLSFAKSALKFCMSFKEISSIIVGMSSKSEIGQNIEIKYNKLRDEIIWKNKIKKIYLS